MTWRSMKVAATAATLATVMPSPAFTQQPETVCLNAECAAINPGRSSLYDVYDDLREVETGMAREWAKALEPGRISVARNNCIQVCDAKARANQTNCRRVHGFPRPGESPVNAHSRYICLDVMHYKQRECLNTPTLNACVNDTLAMQADPASGR